MPAAASASSCAVIDGLSTALPCHHHRVHGLVSAMTGGQVRWPDCASGDSTQAGAVRRRDSSVQALGSERLMYGSSDNKSGELVRSRESYRVFVPHSQWTAMGGKGKPRSDRRRAIE